MELETVPVPEAASLHCYKSRRGKGATVQERRGLGMGRRMAGSCSAVCPAGTHPLPSAVPAVHSFRIRIGPNGSLFQEALSAFPSFYSAPVSVDAPHPTPWVAPQHRAQLVLSSSGHLRLGLHLDYPLTRRGPVPTPRASVLSPGHRGPPHHPPRGPWWPSSQLTNEDSTETTQRKCSARTGSAQHKASLTK